MKIESGLSNPQLLSDFVNRDLLAVLAHALEMNLTGGESEEGIIAANTDIGAGMDLGAALAHQDVAGEDKLAVGALDAKARGFAVASVLGRTDTFLMSKEL